MIIWECFETESFNELVTFTFDEVRLAFTRCAYYVSQSDAPQLINESNEIKKWYREELEKIEKYTKEEYTNNVNMGIDIPEYDEPEFMVRDVELKTKAKLIRLISKYFNRDVFQRYKTELYGLKDFKEETLETPHELWVMLNVHKDHIYSILSIIGYYQRHWGYFLSSSDFYKICYDYSHQVYCINKNLGMKYRFVNIFLGKHRIKSSKSKKSDDVDPSYQNNKFIDVDKISILMLLQPYLKHNTQEIKTIIEIMMKNLRGRHGGLAWDETIKEVDAFISKCEAKGIMKRV